MAASLDLLGSRMATADRDKMGRGPARDKGTVAPGALPHGTSDGSREVPRIHVRPESQLGVEGQAGAVSSV